MVERDFVTRGRSGPTDLNDLDNALDAAERLGLIETPFTPLQSLLQNRALSCGTGPLGYGWRV